MLLQTIYLIFVFLYPTYSNGNVEDKQPVSGSKKIIIEDIIQKITNLTRKTFSKAAEKDKPKVLHRLHDVLLKVTNASGIDKKYVGLIMRGINITASNIPSTKQSKQTDSDVKIDNQSIGLPININRSNMFYSKQQVANKISNEIEMLLTKYLKLVSTPEDKIEILEKIRNKVMDSAYAGSIDHYKESRGIAMIMQNYTRVIDVHRRKIDDDIDNLIQKADALQDNILKNVDHVSEVMNDEISYTQLNRTRDPRCEIIEEDTCRGAEELKYFQCVNGRNVAIEKLCDEELNCEDSSDEVNCFGSVKEKIAKARAVISNVDLTVVRKCFSPNSSKLFRTSDVKVLHESLQSQMKFLEQLSSTQLPLIKSRSNKSKITYNDFAVLLSTLSMTLARSLCMSDDTVESEFRTEDIDEYPVEIISSPKCVCKGQFCETKDCNLNGSPCKRICWQRYNLNTWGCRASNGGTSVTLDEICDGKLDCFDETDENDCVSGLQRTKFEAVDAYNSVLEMILDKAKIKEYENIRNNLLVLHDLVKKLQKSSIMSSVDPQDIKQQRDEIFDMLVDIYEDTFRKSPLAEIDKTYEFLILVNEKLVEAMKRSHTGNKAIFPADECICKEGHCILRRCTKKCLRSCLIEPRLKRFVCAGTGGNVTVAINAICNSKKDCPNEDDEYGCRKDEICRAHHYVLLRRNLRDLGENKKGTSLGEVLVAWKTMATADLIVAEDNHKITPMIFAERVGALLESLMTAYVNMKENKHTQEHSDYIVKEFEKIAAIVMMALKSCGK